MTDAPHRDAGANRRRGRPRRSTRPLAERRETPAGPALDLTRITYAAADATFASLGVPPTLVESLKGRGITEPFPIQVAAMPDALAGRDVLGRGKTGSGKTLAFALPIVARLTGGERSRPGHPRAMVLVPTRELANQVHAVIAPLAATARLRTATIFGGVSQGPQATALRNGVDVIIACPGRLEDLVGQGLCHLDAVEITVLDEADHMADLGFLPGVRRLLDRTPAGCQRLLFSATLDAGVDVIVRRYLTDPVVHAVDPPTGQVSTMVHHVLTVEPSDRVPVVTALAGGQGRSVLFTRTKHGAKKLAKYLTAAGIPSVELHGNLGQNARERNLAAFSSGEVRVMVATDIAARGIHVDDIELVVHVDPPTEHKAYLHRSGRTARAGAGGVVITIQSGDQVADVRTLMRQAAVKPNVATVGPDSALVHQLAGNKAAYVAPAPPPVAVAPTARRRPAGSAGTSRARSSGRPPGVSGAGTGGGRGRSARPGSARSR